jgi:hypothetical protein
MAAFTPTKIDLTQINGGQEYLNGDGVNADSVNAAIEASAWAQDHAETAETNSENALNNSQTPEGVSAISIAQKASSDASNAVSTANTASTNASSAVSTANTASQNATQAVNTANNALAWAQALTAEPDLTEAGNVGTPSVSFVDNGEYKKFKFSNLKGATGASIKDIDFIYQSETSTETVYDVQTTLDDDTVIDSGDVTIPKAAIPKVSEIAEEGQVTPSDDLMLGGFFMTEV